MNTESGNPGNKSEHSKPTPEHKRSGFTFACIFLIFCILAIGATVFLLREPITISNTKTPIQKAEEQSDAPISIIAKQPAGVTIVEKMPELEEQQPVTTASAPTASGATSAQNFAIDLGAAESYLDLSRRFAAFSSLNNPSQLHQLEPRALLIDTDDGLQARLLVGPIQTFLEAERACETFSLPQGVRCIASEFKGELIARQP